MSVHARCTPPHTSSVPSSGAASSCYMQTCEPACTAGVCDGTRPLLSLKLCHQPRTAKVLNHPATTGRCPLHQAFPSRTIARDHQLTRCHTAPRHSSQLLSVLPAAAATPHLSASWLSSDVYTKLHDAAALGWLQLGAAGDWLVREAAEGRQPLLLPTLLIAALLFGLLSWQQRPRGWAAVDLVVVSAAVACWMLFLRKRTFRDP